MTRPPRPIRHTLRLYGHRGAPSRFPENTLAGFAAALQEGANALELDIHRTADRRFVVAHDPDGRRTAGVPEQIRSVTLDQVKRWQLAPGIPRTDPGGLSVPTLEEVLEAFPDVPMSIDLKPDDPAAVPPLLELLARQGASSRVTLASFSTRIVRSIRRLGYPGRTALSKVEVAIVRLLPAAVARHFVLGDVAAVPVKQGPVRLDASSFIARCHRLGLRLDYWVVNDPEEARRLLDAGATGIVTDDPARIVPVFRERWGSGPHSPS
ncbi:MAG TPA: hypothetical protein ENK19_07740 [Acidobacteria bacterium]|nr:hypothetical protein [Acidobacteriota bacterium]